MINNLKFKVQSTINDSKFKTQNSNLIFSGIMCFVLWVMIFGCGKAQNVTNQQLSAKLSLSAAKDTVSLNEQLQISANLENAGSETYTYEWGASGGTVQYVGTYGGNSILWTAPSLAGDYTVLVTVKNSKGESSVSTLNLSVVDNTTTSNTNTNTQNTTPNAAPNVKVSASTLSGEASLAVSFNADCSDDKNCTSYLWDFGDGTTASSKSSAHSFNNAGTYPVTFTATDADGAKTTSTLLVQVSAKNNLPQINISSDVATGNAPLSINFNSTCSDSDGSCASIIWNVGDGKIYTGSTLNYAFVSAGNYKVSATATDDKGSKNTSFIDVTVNATPAGSGGSDSGSTGSGSNTGGTQTTTANQLPSVSLTADKLSGTYPLTINFTALAQDNDGTIASYQWDFNGDGIIDSTTTTGQTSYIYNSAGSFMVYVTVSDNNGALSNTITQVLVSAPQNYPPALTASANPLSGYSPLTVSFIASATDENNSTLTYLWDFGDGQTSTDKIVSHNYSAKGNYTAKITVTDEKGQSISQTFNIEVKEQAVISSIEISTTSSTTIRTAESLNVTATAKYSDNTTQNITSAVQWNLSNSTLGSMVFSKFTAQAEGTLTITATYQGITSNAISITIANPVVQNNPPTVVVTKYEENKYTPLIVDFYSVCTDIDGTCKSYSWDFGDGQTSTEQNPKHTFNSEGSYIVKLTVTDDKGATAISTVTISATKWPYKNKYPIILAHGFSGWDVLVGYEYFFGVKDYLTAKGYLVYATSVDAFNTIEVRGSQLANQITSILQQTGAAKVNLIGHSMGGLDARYAITTLGLGDKVASLTTISTPHYGTPVADVGLGLIPGGPVTDAINALVSWGGCTLLTGSGYTNCKQNVMKAAAQLTTTYVKNTFNPATPNDSRVKYYSYAGATGLLDSLDIPSPAVSATYSLIYLYEGKNDGMCSVKSSTWGEFKGQLSADHLDEIGQIAGITGLFDYLTFYENIAGFLVGQGF